MSVDRSWFQSQQSCERRALQPRHDESLREYIDRTIVGIVPRVGYAEYRAPSMVFLDVSYVWAHYTPVFVSNFNVSIS